ncbi:MAG: hypothetical protein H0X31_06105 [Nostocaceae cyanobacterium]|nr:hypothetical protein [Nostocaceae cyanobacterium]
MTDTKYISTADTAKVIRQELKKHFTGVKFSVRSKSYSGGASIDIDWTDGPAEKEVEAIVDQFKGSTFNSSEDLKSTRYSTWNGETVRWGSDFVFTHRSFSKDFFEKVASEVANEYGFEIPEVKVDCVVVSGKQRFSSPYIEKTEFLHSSCETLADMVYREIRQRSLCSPQIDNNQNQLTPPDITVTENEAKNGIEVRFASKPLADVIESLKTNGFYWSRFNSCWYAKKSPLTSTFAYSLVSTKNEEKSVKVDEDNFTEPEVEPWCQDIQPSYRKIEPFFIDAQFPHLNKNSWLSEYTEQIVTGEFDIERCLVQEFIELSPEDFDSFTTNLLETCSWISGKGGYGTTTPISRPVERYSEYTDVEKAEYSRGLYRKCLAVSAPTRPTILIDPQGFSYARYVAFVDQQAIDCLVEEYQFKNIISISPKRKGLRVHVYRNAAHCDCSNGGVTSIYSTLTMVGDGIPEVSEETESAPAIVLRIKAIQGGKNVFCEPLNNPTGKHYGFGGNFVYSSDSRYRELFRRFPVPVHDRQE